MDDYIEKYTWECSNCQHEWESFTNDDEQVTCPKCGCFIVHGGLQL